MAWGPLGAALVVITVVQRPWEGHRLSLSLVRIAVGLAAAASAFGLDDTAACTVASSPSTLAHRRMAHLALSLAGSAVVAGGTCLVVAAIGGTEQLDPVRVALESSGMFLGVSASALVLGADRGVALFGGALLASLAVQQRFPT